MYRIKHFLGENFERFNAIIDSFNGMESSYINLEACCSCPFYSVLQAQKAPIYILPTEGIVGNRYFPNMDSIEEIDVYAEELIIDLFEISKDEYKASTQPHSGTQANQIVYNAILEDGDTIISLDPKSGGHISHNKICRNVRIINFGLTEQNDIDYDSIENLVNKHNPKLVVIGASSYANNIDYNRIIQIAHSKGSLVLADICHTALYILGKRFTSPFPHADFVTFTMEKTLRGPQGGVIIYKKDFASKIEYSIFPKTQGGPLQSLQFAKLACLIELKSTNLALYAQTVQKNAKIMNDIFLDSGLKTFSKDNSTHIILINAVDLGLTGQEAENLLFKGHILANKNIIPKDKLSPEITSGIRLGTTYITNQGYEEKDVAKLSNYIVDILKYGQFNDTCYIDLNNKYNMKF